MFGFNKRRAFDFYVVRMESNGREWAMTEYKVMTKKEFNASDNASFVSSHSTKSVAQDKAIALNGS